MIVLDEQLLGRGIKSEISKWYRGKTCFITDLRPGTVIKDDAVAGLLRQNRGSTFVTINVRDFWKRIAADPRYCVACMALSDPEASFVPELLRPVFRVPQLRTSALRSGKVLRIRRTGLSFYTQKDSRVQTVRW